MENAIFSNKNFSSAILPVESAVELKVKDEPRSEELETEVTCRLDPLSSIVEDEKREIKVEINDALSEDLVLPAESTSLSTDSSQYMGADVIIKKEEDLGTCFQEREEDSYYEVEAHPTVKIEQGTVEIGENGTGLQVPTTTSSMEAEGSTECDSLQAVSQMPISECPFQCSECGVKFRSKKSLKLHTTVLHKKAFTCLHCTAAFSSGGEWKLHLTSHSGEKLFSCRKCPAMLKDKELLREHMICHSSDGQFPCIFCPAAFSGRQDLDVHLAAHSSKGLFSCPKCVTTFKQKHHLKQHLKQHLIDVETKKPFSCAHCLSTFKRYCDLQKHMRRHPVVPIGRK